MMKRKLLAMQLAAVLVLSMAGCGAKGTDNVSQTPASGTQEAVQKTEAPASSEAASVEESKEETVTSEEELTEEQIGDRVGMLNTESSFAGLEATYHKILNRIYEAGKNYDEEFFSLPGMYGLQEVAIYNQGENFLKNVGYTFLDIDNDGTKELLIGEIGSDTINACFTDRDVAVFEGWSRNKMQLIPSVYGNGYSIYNMASGGAATTAFGVFEMDPVANRLYCVDFYFSDFIIDTDQQIGVFAGADGSMDQTQAFLTDMTEDDLWNYGDSLAEQVLPIYYNAFGEYKYIEDTAVGTKSNVQKALYLGTCEFVADVRYGDSGDYERYGYSLIIGDTSEYATNVLITPNMDLTDVSLCKMNVVGYEENEYGPVVKYALEYRDININFQEGRPILLHMTFEGDTAGYCIVGRNIEYGDYVYTLAIEMSGEDGSLMFSGYGQNWDGDDYELVYPIME